MSPTTDARKPPRAAALVRSFVIDGSILAGAGLLGYGAWLAYRPAGFLVAGALFLAAGLKATRK
jgi:hypothetical protein